jgi:hypothetical protein
LLPSRKLGSFRAKYLKLQIEKIFQDLTEFLTLCYNSEKNKISAKKVCASGRNLLNRTNIGRTVDRASDN